MSFLDSLARVAAFVDGWRHGAALIGGLAIVARVRARPTRDADLIIVVDDDETDDLLAHAEAFGYIYPDDVGEWIAGGLLPLRDTAAHNFGVDLILADDAFFEAVVTRATPVMLGDVELPTATLEDLVVLKLHAGRPIDIDDVLAIKDAYAQDLDIDYLQAAASAVGVTTELAHYFGPFD